MSRLDSAIRRLQAQRACLDLAAAAVAGVPGVIFELGLGNGRTFDHLRERLPGREIFVFERKVAAHPSCIPDDEHLMLGDFAETLPPAVERMAGMVAMVHGDVGAGRAEIDAEIAALISRTLLPALAPGAIVLCDQPLDLAGAEALPLPEGVKPGRYHLYRRPDDSAA